MQSVKYTGTNYGEVKALCGDKVLAPYFCMGGWITHVISQFLIDKAGFRCVTANNLSHNYLHTNPRSNI